MKRKKYFDWEQALHFIWQGADHDGVWSGGAAILAAAFDVSEDDAYTMLRDLCQRRALESLYTGSYIIVKWREKDNPDSESPA